MMMMMNSFCGVWLTDQKPYFKLATIDKDCHHRETLTHCVQILNLRKIWVQVKLFWIKLNSSDNNNTTAQTLWQGILWNLFKNL